MPTTTNPPAPRRHTLRDYLAYVGISVAFVVLAVGGLFLGDEWSPFLHWFWFLVYTGMIFGIYLQQSRAHWQRPAFWYGSSVLLMLHLLFFLFLLHKGLIGQNQRIGQYVVIEGLILRAISWDYKSPVDRTLD